MQVDLQKISFFEGFKIVFLKWAPENYLLFLDEFYISRLDVLKKF